MTDAYNIYLSASYLWLIREALRIDSREVNYTWRVISDKTQFETIAKGTNHANAAR